jgi:hypothetical protein
MRRGKENPFYLWFAPSFPRSLSRTPIREWESIGHRA